MKSAPAAPLSPRSRLRALVLGTDPRQQLRVSQVLLVLLLYVAFASIQHLEVMLGLLDRAASWPLTAFNLAGSALFYGLVRSGINRRVKHEPALTVPQLLWALAGLSWAYAITGPARGALLVLMMLTLLFGVFALKPAQSRAVGLLAFVMLGSVMIWKTLTDPQTHDARVELVYLAFAVVSFAGVCAVSIRVGRLRARLEQQRSALTQALARIQALATHDELTGLVNRRAVLDRMHGELAARQRQQPVMSVALIDIDHFKRVNDQHGHAAGDAVLRRFAACAGAELRTGDVLARWGGEEFLLVLPATDAALALPALNRLRERLAAEPFDDLAPGLRVTCSAGLAECRGQGDREAAIERADAAMYRAKSAGRNRVCGPAQQLLPA